MPCQFVAVDVNYHVSVGRAAAVDMPRPPSPASSPDVVLVKLLRHFNVLEEMRMPAEHVYTVALQNLGQPTGVAHVAASRHGVPSRRVHVQYDKRAFWHVAQVLFEPLHLPISHAFNVLPIAYVVDVFHRHDVRLAHVERVVGRAEPFVIFHLGVHGSAKPHVVQLLPTFVEVVVAYTVVKGHARVPHRLPIIIKQKHVVENDVSQRDSHHLAPPLERVHCVADVGHGLAEPPAHVALVAHLGV